MCFGFYYIKETGKRCSPDEAAVIVPNHVSFIEPVYLAGCHMLSAVSRAANARAPIIGRGILALQCILVGACTPASCGKRKRQLCQHLTCRREWPDRLDPQSRTKTKEAIAQRAVPGSGWGQFMIFPEGTTCNTKAVISFRYGAFTPGQVRCFANTVLGSRVLMSLLRFQPVQPVAIRYPAKHFDPCWVVQGPGALGLSLRMLCQFVNHVRRQRGLCLQAGVAAHKLRLSDGGDMAAGRQTQRGRTKRPPALLAQCAKSVSNVLWVATVAMA